MTLIVNEIKDMANVYVTPYPTIGVEPYCGITEEDLNPTLNKERVTYYENHLSKEYFNDEDTPMVNSDFELHDDVFLKLQSARSKVQHIEEVIADNALLKQAQVEMYSTYVTDDQYRSCLLIPLTIMVTPATAKDFILRATIEIAHLLELSEQAMENL